MLHVGGDYVQLKVAVCEDEKNTSEYLCEQISEINPFLEKLIVILLIFVSIQKV